MEVADERRDTLLLVNLMIRAILTCLISSVLTYSLIWISQKGFLPKDKKSQKPFFGGLAIYISFWLNYYMAWPYFDTRQWGLLIASTVVLLTGLLDDCLTLSPVLKSIGIIIACHLIYRVDHIVFTSAILDTFPSWMSGPLAYVFTLIWIYFLTNAFNLIDGIDGLSSSVSITSLVSMIMVTLSFSLTIQVDFVLMLLLLLSAILGFWIFNWPPAKIILGDTGSLFIGFMYAAMTVRNLKHASLYTLVLPVLIYAVPLFDTIYAIIRRFLNGQPITLGDRDHIHHRLLRRGWTQGQINFLMLIMTMMFSVLAFALQAYPQYKVSIFSVIIMILLSMALWTYFLGKDNRS